MELKDNWDMATVRCAVILLSFLHLFDSPSFECHLLQCDVGKESFVCQTATWSAN